MDDPLPSGVISVPGRDGVSQAGTGAVREPTDG